MCSLVPIGEVEFLEVPESDSDVFPDEKPELWPRELDLYIGRRSPMAPRSFLLELVFLTFVWSSLAVILSISILCESRPNCAF